LFYLKAVIINMMAKKNPIIFLILIFLSLSNLGCQAGFWAEDHFKKGGSLSPPGTPSGGEGSQQGDSLENQDPLELLGIHISQPSLDLVKSGPVTFNVVYGSNVATDSISLAADKVILHGENAGCLVTGIVGVGSVRTITINHCTGTGFVSLSIASGTALLKTEGMVSSAGPSSQYKVDNSGPTVATQFSLGVVPNLLTETPTISFSGSVDIGYSQIAGYEVRLERAVDDLVIQDWLPHTTGQSIKGLSLSLDTEYRVRLRALDLLGNRGVVHSGILWKTTNNPCPNHYIFVSSLSGYTTTDFCVAQYEMKNVNGVATSQPSGMPWVEISRGLNESSPSTAWKACRDLGPQYNLISNAQWQTIARHIVNTAYNWSSGVVYSGQLNQGHSDGFPNHSLSVENTSNACVGTGETCSFSQWNEQRRIHILNNGHIIWDFSGNVWEWVLDNNTSDQGTDDYISMLGSGDGRRALYGSSQNCHGFSTVPYCGFGYGSTQYSGGAILRGGGWSNGLYTGIFSVSLFDGPQESYPAVGFRCVYTP
jgi:hypothetical protein